MEIPDQESFVPADLESGEGTFYFGAAVYALSHFIFDEVDEDDIKMEYAASFKNRVAEYKKIMLV